MIVVGGEALVDLVGDRTPSAAEPSQLTPRLGGGPYNVAIALGRLGTPVSFLSRVSTDDFGIALFERLVASGVDSSLLQRGSEPSSLAIATTGPDGSARYSFHVAGSADRHVADPGPLPQHTRALSLGTLSLVLEPGATTYETLLHREAARGTFIALDPNVRSALIEDPDEYRRRFESWLPDVGLLKLSAEDALWLSGDDEPDPLRAARRWARQGPSAVVLTHGAQGMVVVTREGTETEAPGTRSSVVDTIGAGDTVQAALLHWLHEREILTRSAVAQMSPEQWRSAMSFAAEAAAMTCSRPGAEPPWAAELRERALEVS
jgi:fructokinase